MDDIWTSRPEACYRDDLGNWRNGIDNVDELYVSRYLLYINAHTSKDTTCVRNTFQKRLLSPQLSFLTLILRKRQRKALNFRRTFLSCETAQYRIFSQPKASPLGKYRASQRAMSRRMKLLLDGGYRKLRPRNLHDRAYRTRRPGAFYHSSASVIQPLPPRR